MPLPMPFEGNFGRLFNSANPKLPQQFPFHQRFPQPGGFQPIPFEGGFQPPPPVQIPQASFLPFDAQQPVLNSGLNRLELLRMLLNQRGFADPSRRQFRQAQF